jgi:uncharacterized cofD-like protein
MAVLLVHGVADAVRAARGPRVLVGNLMTQPGETLGMTMTDHMDAIDRHAGPGLVDAVLLNATAIRPNRLRSYAEQQAELVSHVGLADRSETIYEAPLVNEFGKIRHDPTRLADALIRIASKTADTSAQPHARPFVSRPGGSIAP